MSSIASKKKKESEKLIREYETGKALVEYGNEFALSINTYSAYELDLLLTLLYSARKMVKDHKAVSEKENLKLDIPSSFIKKGIQGNMSNDRIKNALIKIFNANIFLKKGEYVEVKHLFETLKYNDDLTEVNFELKKEYIHVFFNLVGNFAQHELLEFTKLKGKYTKKIYQIIMAHKYLKKKEYPADLFKRTLDIPANYNWSDITERVIKKTKAQFEHTNIENFEVEKIKEGKEITKVILRWDIRDPEVIDADEEEKPKKIKASNLKEQGFKSISRVTFRTPEELTKEQEEEAIDIITEKEGITKEYLLTMKKKSKTMYYNTLRNVLKGV